MSDREKNMALLLRKLGFQETQFNLYWKLGIETLEQMFLSQVNEE